MCGDPPLICHRELLLRLCSRSRVWRSALNPVIASFCCVAICFNLVIASFLCVAICFWILFTGRDEKPGELGSTANVIIQVDCCASNPPSSHHSFAINKPYHSYHHCRRIEGTMRSSIRLIKVPSITPYEKILRQSRVERSAKRFRHREPLLRGDLS